MERQKQKNIITNRNMEQYNGRHFHSSRHMVVCTVYHAAKKAGTLHCVCIDRKKENTVSTPAYSSSIVPSPKLLQNHTIFTLCTCLPCRAGDPTNLIDLFRPFRRNGQPKFRFFSLFFSFQVVYGGLDYSFCTLRKNCYKMQMCNSVKFCTN